MPPVTPPPFPIPSLSDDDCNRPSCAGIQDALRHARKEAMKPNSSTNLPFPSGNNSRPQPKLDENTSPNLSACPPHSAQLGKSSWDLLHSMVAWYPDKPTQEEMHLITNFFSGLARFYPCSWCAADFSENLKTKPVRAETREDLCVWLCEQHNKVNTKLGKPSFPCTLKSLDERWRKSSNPKCQSDH